MYRLNNAGSSIGTQDTSCGKIYLNAIRNSMVSQEGYFETIITSLVKYGVGG